MRSEHPHSFLNSQSALFDRWGLNDEGRDFMGFKGIEKGD
jgi:hypothetical protein